MIDRKSHNHDLDPSCNEHPTGDCIIQELRGKLDDIRLALEARYFEERYFEECYWGGQAIMTLDIRNILDRNPND